MKFTIFGPPRTKKNHGKVIMRGKRRFHVQSDASHAWETSAVVQLLRRGRPEPMPGTRALEPLNVDRPVSVRALVYREKNVGDLVGYLQAIGDALEKAQVIVNDRLIASWDGSRLLKDAANPRVELEVLPVES